MYLNKFDFLNNAVGIKTAAHTYFACEPKDLKIEEAATLVGMCKNPSLYNPVLLDEPCSALDPISTGRIEELITELKQDYTVVIVTHNMQQAARCSDHTAFMYLGELIEFSNTDDLFTKPAKKQTEDYITGRYG